MTSYYRSSQGTLNVQNILFNESLKLIKFLLALLSV